MSTHNLTFTNSNEATNFKAKLISRGKLSNGQLTAEIAITWEEHLSKNKKSKRARTCHGWQIDHSGERFRVFWDKQFHWNEEERRFDLEVIHKTIDVKKNKLI